MSIKEIAKKVGTSPATVSRVLNNPDYRCQVSGLREKIWEAAMELNYTPNTAAQNLRKGLSGHSTKTFYINIVVTRAADAETDPFFSELLRIIESEVHRFGHILHKVWYVPAFSDNREIRKVNPSNIIREMKEASEYHSDGLVVLGKCHKEVLLLLEKEFRNIVSINRSSTGHFIDEVTCDGKQIASQAVEYLISLGHKDIGYMGECRDELRYRGFLETMERHNLEPKISYLYECHLSEAAGYEAMEELMDNNDLPTALYCANDIIAIGALKAMEKRKKWNFNLAVISSDDIEKAQFSTPMLTTVQLPKEEMGKWAVSILLDRIMGGHSAIMTCELSTKIIKRESCFSSFEAPGEYSI